MHNLYTSRNERKHSWSNHSSNIWQ